MSDLPVLTTVKQGGVSPHRQTEQTRAQLSAI